MSIVAEEMGSCTTRQPVPAAVVSHRSGAALPRFVAGVRVGLPLRFVPVRAAPRHSERHLARLPERLLLARRRLAPARWLGDQQGSAVYQKLERGPADGVADIEQATGESFPALFADSGSALYMDNSGFAAGRGTGQHALHVAQPAAAVGAPVRDVERRIRRSARVAAPHLPRHTRFFAVGAAPRDDDLLSTQHANDRGAGDDRILWPRRRQHSARHSVHSWRSSSFLS